MNEKAITEYNAIINTFEVLLLAMKQIQSENNNIAQDSIIERSEQFLRDLQLFCIHHVGFIDEEV